MDSNVKVCRHCGVEFVRPKSGKNYPGFCSGKHMAAFYRDRRLLNPPPLPESKRCKQCGEVKRADAFPRLPTSADGLHVYCRECLRDRRRENYSTRPRETRIAYHHEHQANDPAYREAARARAREHYYDNYESEREKRRQRYHEMTDEQREKRRAGYRASKDRKRARVDAAKEGKSCIRCGESHPAALQFHHRDPTTKLFNIADGIVSGGWTEEQIREEIAKTDILCANCHRIIHWEERRRVG